MIRPHSMSVRIISSNQSTPNKGIVVAGQHSHWFGLLFLCNREWKKKWRMLCWKAFNTNERYNTKERERERDISQRKYGLKFKKREEKLTVEKGEVILKGDFEGIDRAFFFFFLFWLVLYHPRNRALTIWEISNL